MKLVHRFKIPAFLFVAVVIFAFGSVHAATKTWTFDTSSNYTFDNGVITVTGGNAQLAATSTPAWYSTNWTKRKPVSVDNTGNASTLTDYQVEIVVAYDADMQADFDDIRFTNSDGTTALDYWLESKTNSSTATFWVEVPSIAGSSTHTVYMYYGNSSASSASNGDNTFAFFDDFEIAERTEALTFGTFTSVEYGNEDDESKLQAAVSYYNTSGVSFVLELGDFIDYDAGVGGSNRANTLIDLDAIEDVYNDLSMDRYYALSNHDLDYISKEDFYDHTGMTEGYYSFDVGDYHFVVLDASFNTDDDDDHYDSGNFVWNTAYVPPSERTWLTNDLASSTKKTIIFVEQQLTTMGSCGTDYVIKNASAVRTILENDGDVIGVFHGHCGANASATLNGIDYYALRAMDLATNAYSKVTIYTDDSIDIQGFGEQTSYSGIEVLDTDKWDQTGTPVISNTDGVLTIDSDANDTYEGISTKAFTMDSGVAEFRFAETVGDETGVGILKPNLSGGASRFGVLFFPTSNTGNELRRYNGGSGSTNFNANVPGAPWTGSIAWDGSNFEVFYNDVTQWSSTLSSSALKITAESYKLNDVDLDWVFVRSYTATEPSTSLGDEVNLYATTAPSIVPTAGNAQTFTVLSGFTSSETTNGGSIRYQVSNDDGSTWYWYNSGWVSTIGGYSESNAVADINTNIGALAIGDGSFLFKAFLSSNGSQLVQLGDVTVTYTDDGTAPVLSSVAVDAENTTATVTWTTDEASSSMVEYGETTSYGSSTTETDTSPRVTSHTVSLSSLSACTTYHYRVTSTDAYSNQVVGPDATFTTTGCTATNISGSSSSSSFSRQTQREIFTPVYPLIQDIPVPEVVTSNTPVETETIAEKSTAEMSEELVATETSLEQEILDEPEQVVLQQEVSIVPASMTRSFFEGVSSAFSGVFGRSPDVPAHLKGHRYQKVSVRLVDDAQQPIVGATVTLFSEPKIRITDEDGVAVFEDVEIGEHTMEIEHDEYQASQKIFLDKDADEIHIDTQATFTNGVSPLWRILGIVVFIYMLFKIVRRRLR